jgi:phage-related protein
VINYFTLNGKKSRDFGLYTTGSGAFNAPERDVEVIQVPGRNGNLIIDHGRFKNATQSYKAFIHQNFSANAENVRSWLLSDPGYRRLEDTYNPQTFRLARFAGPINMDVRALCAGAEMELFFDCKPQRFLKTGEQPLKLTASGVVRNPTQFAALPLLNVIGSGSGILTIGSETIEISEITDTLTIDCELQDAYSGGASKNDTVALSDFPQLHPGSNNVYFSGGITAVEIIPRWWTL